MPQQAKPPIWSITPSKKRERREQSSEQNGTWKPITKSPQPTKEAGKTMTLNYCNVQL